MSTTTTSNTDLSALLDRVVALEARVAQLEQTGAPHARAVPRTSRGERNVELHGVGTSPYEPAALDVSDTWIELHEQSARPQLQRLIREVVGQESPVTDRLVLDRVRRAWGLKRAGGRVQEAFDQSVRQLLARGLIERHADALRRPGHELSQLRVPGADEDARRGAEDVPLDELALGVAAVTSAAGGSLNDDDATMHVAKLLGWTRRGGAIQERFDAALEHGERVGRFERRDGQIHCAS